MLLLLKERIVLYSNKQKKYLIHLQFIQIYRLQKDMYIRTLMVDCVIVKFILNLLKVYTLM